MQMIDTRSKSNYKRSRQTFTDSKAINLPAGFSGTALVRPVFDLPRVINASKEKLSEILLTDFPDHFKRQTMSDSKKDEAPPHRQYTGQLPSTVITDQVLIQETFNLFMSRDKFPANVFASHIYGQALQVAAVGLNPENDGIHNIPVRPVGQNVYNMFRQVRGDTELQDVSYTYNSMLGTQPSVISGQIQKNMKIVSNINMDDFIGLAECFLEFVRTSINPQASHKDKMRRHNALVEIIAAIQYYNSQLINKQNKEEYPWVFESTLLNLYGDEAGLQSKQRSVNSHSLYTNDVSTGLFDISNDYAFDLSDRNVISLLSAGSLFPVPNFLSTDPEIQHSVDSSWLTSICQRSLVSMNTYLVFITALLVGTNAYYTGREVSVVTAEVSKRFTITQLDGKEVLQLNGYNTVATAPMQALCSQAFGYKTAFTSILPPYYNYSIRSYSRNELLYMCPKYRSSQAWYLNNGYVSLKQSVTCTIKLPRLLDSKFRQSSVKIAETFVKNLNFVKEEVKLVTDDEEMKLEDESVEEDPYSPGILPESFFSDLKFSDLTRFVDYAPLIIRIDYNYDQMLTEMVQNPGQFNDIDMQSLVDEVIKSNRQKLPKSVQDKLHQIIGPKEIHLIPSLTVVDLTKITTQIEAAVAADVNAQEFITDNLHVFFEGTDNNTQKRQKLGGLFVDYLKAIQSSVLPILIQTDTPTFKIPKFKYVSNITMLSMGYRPHPIDQMLTQLDGNCDFSVPTLILQREDIRILRKRWKKAKKTQEEGIITTNITDMDVNKVSLDAVFNQYEVDRSGKPILPGGTKMPTTEDVDLDADEDEAAQKEAQQDKYIEDDASQIQRMRQEALEDIMGVFPGQNIATDLDYIKKVRSYLELYDIADITEIKNYYDLAVQRLPGQFEGVNQLSFPLSVLAKEEFAKLEKLYKSKTFNPERTIIGRDWRSAVAFVALSRQMRELQTTVDFLQDRFAAFFALFDKLPPLYISGVFIDPMLLPHKQVALLPQHDWSITFYGTYIKKFISPGSSLLNLVKQKPIEYVSKYLPKTVKSANTNLALWQQLAVNDFRIFVTSQTQVVTDPNIMRQTALDARQSINRLQYTISQKSFKAMKDYLRVTSGASNFFWIKPFFSTMMRFRQYVQASLASQKFYLPALEGCFTNSQFSSFMKDLTMLFGSSVLSYVKYPDQNLVTQSSTIFASGASQLAFVTHSNHYFTYCKQLVTEMAGTNSRQLLWNSNETSFQPLSQLSQKAETPGKYRGLDGTKMKLFDAVRYYHQVLVTGTMSAQGIYVRKYLDPALPLGKVKIHLDNVAQINASPNWQPSYMAGLNNVLLTTFGQYVQSLVQHFKLYSFTPFCVEALVQINLSYFWDSFSSAELTHKGKVALNYIDMVTDDQMNQVYDPPIENFSYENLYSHMLLLPRKDGKEIPYSLEPARLKLFPLKEEQLVQAFTELFDTATDKKVQRLLEYGKVLIKNYSGTETQIAKKFEAIVKASMTQITIPKILTWCHFSDRLGHRYLADPDYIMQQFSLYISINSKPNKQLTAVYSQKYLKNHLQSDKNGYVHPQKVSFFENNFEDGFKFPSMTIFDRLLVVFGNLLELAATHHEVAQNATVPFLTVETITTWQAGVIEPGIHLLNMFMPILIHYDLGYTRGAKDNELYILLHTIQSYAIEMKRQVQALSLLVDGFTLHADDLKRFKQVLETFMHPFTVIIEAYFKAPREFNPDKQLEKEQKAMERENVKKRTQEVNQLMNSMTEQDKVIYYEQNKRIKVKDDQ